MCFLIKLGRHVNHGERMNPIDFGGHSSQVKVKMSIIDKCGVRGDATLCVVIFTQVSRFFMTSHEPRRFRAIFVRNFFKIYTLFINYLYFFVIIIMIKRI